MAQPTVNRFYKGLNSDVSRTLRGQDNYVDGHNIRLARREEGTLWAANIRGNEETFQLTEGFIPIGSVEFDGYLFIFSTNPTNGIGEIGSFPSPLITGGIGRVYRPLQNFTTSDFVQQIGDDCLLPDVTNLGNFTTSHLSFQCDKPLRVEARLDFDGSVNIYFTDDLNPWRVINNGFNLETGESNRRYITENMILNGYINGINESEKHPIIDLINEGTGGRLKVGMYFFFVRYTDLNFNSTSFLGQSGPIPVFFTNVIGTTITFGGGPDAVTDKLLDIIVSNLDPSIGFFEVGYIRYYGDELFESVLIDKRYSIVGNTFRQITITGNEPTIALGLDEIITQKPSDALYARDITQLQNKFFIANTRGPQLDHPDLRKFMCNLSLSEGLVNNGPADEIYLGQNNNPYSPDAQDTEERLGYFSGETYVFACIPVFKGGFKGLPYPMTGFDNYQGLMANTNKQGIYRFNKAHNAQFWNGTDTFIKNINVNTTQAQAIYNASQWLQDNLIGVYVARAERNKILLYQGLSLRCYNGNMNPRLYDKNISLNQYEKQGTVVPISFSGGGGWQPNPEDWYSSRSNPLFEPATYEILSKVDRTNIGVNFRSVYFNYAAPFELDTRNDFTDPSRLAIFCADYYMDKINVPDTSYIQLIGTTNYYNDWRRESSSLNPIPVNNRNGISAYRQTPTDDGPDPIFDVTVNPSIPVGNRGVAQTFLGYNQLGISYQTGGFQSATTDIVGWNAVPEQNLVARLDEGKIASQAGMYYFKRRTVLFEADEFEISLPWAAPDYIGVTNAPTYTPGFSGSTFDHFVDTWDRAIVNVCRTNPDTVNYLDLYDFKSSIFYPIGQFQPIGDFLASSLHTYYRGDCLVKRSYLKIYHGSIEQLSDLTIDVITVNTGQGSLIWAGNNGDDAQEALQDGYGHWVSIVTECSYNADYRHEEGRNLFYPKTSPQQPGTEFAWIYDSPESYFYNRGYQKHLGPVGSIGIDLLQPVSDNRFPTRIRPSLTHIFGAVRDGYRQFIPADAKDFDYQYGEIEAIETLMDMLYSFQVRAINLHPVNERVTQQGTQGSTAILGESSGLTQYRQLVKQGYGTQHRFSVVSANQALYCIDWNKRAILRISGAQVQMLDVEKGAQTWFRDIVALGSSGYSDVLEFLPNSHPCGRGIHGIYNRKYKEVLWTLRMGEQDVTIAFSEEMDCFLGTHGYKPIHYALLEEDLYSFIDHRAWLHDVKSKYDNFYDVQDEWFVKVIVNEGGETTKHWDSLIINSNNRVFSKISYETQHQKALQSPFVPVDEFWYAPTYRENQWRLPIRRQDETQEPEENIYDDFTTDLAPMRGRYLIIKLTYDGDKELWVGDLITFYNPSYV